MNVGPIDRALRMCAGLLLTILPFFPSEAPLIAAPGIWKWVIVAIGIVMLVTAATRYCPAYSIIGVRPRPSK